MTKYTELDADRFVIGFYADDIHGEAGTPDQAEPISDETWETLLNGQSDGKRMRLNQDGSPDLVDPPPLTADQLAANARAQRNAALAATDWIVAQQQEHILNGTAPADPARFKAYATYRQALRDVPQQTSFPHEIAWPAEPA
jgi:hypothetical protein